MSTFFPSVHRVLQEGRGWGQYTLLKMLIFFIQQKNCSLTGTKIIQINNTILKKIAMFHYVIVVSDITFKRLPPWNQRTRLNIRQYFTTILIGITVCLFLTICLPGLSDQRDNHYKCTWLFSSLENKKKWLLFDFCL